MSVGRAAGGEAMGEGVEVSGLRCASGGGFRPNLKCHQTHTAANAQMTKAARPAKISGCDKNLRLDWPIAQLSLSPSTEGVESGAWLA